MPFYTALAKVKAVEITWDSRDAPISMKCDQPFRDFSSSK